MKHIKNNIFDTFVAMQMTISLVFKILNNVSSSFNVITIK